MGNLLATLITSAGAMNVFQKSLDVVQNNVSNANTPGYAKQTQTLEAVDFQPEMGLGGGVRAGNLLSARSEYAEQAVRGQNELYGRYAQKASDLSQIEPLFDIAQNSGISGALSQFFQSCSSLSVSPNDNNARQVVIENAGTLAQSFNQMANGLQNATSNAQKEAGDFVTQVNNLAADLHNLNSQILRNPGASQDAGVDAQVHTDLENLSEVVNFTSMQEPDGTTTVLLGGQSPLVMGDLQYLVQAGSTTPQVQLLDSQGDDITSLVQRGRLSAVLDLKNKLIPGYLSDLNQLAASVADTVNSTLAAGQDSYGNTPAAPLFTYSDNGGAAATIAVSTTFQPGDIGAALPSAPGGNGNALAVAGLESAKSINGYTFTQFYGNLAAGAGRDLATAQQSQQTQQQLLTQAQTARGDISSVSLDEEAANLIQFQRSYQAAAEMITVLNQLTSSLISMMSGA